MNHNYDEEPREELISTAPGFNLNLLSPASQKQLMRSVDAEMVDAMISAVKANCATKAAIVAVTSQAQLEETVTALMKRNPRPDAIRDLAQLAHTNAANLKRLLSDYFDVEWR